MFCRSLFALLYFFFWPLCCLFFFDIRILIALLLSSTLLTILQTENVFESITIGENTIIFDLYIMQTMVIYSFAWYNLKCQEVYVESQEVSYLPVLQLWWKCNNIVNFATLSIGTKHFYNKRSINIIKTLWNIQTKLLRPGGPRRESRSLLFTSLPIVMEMKWQG